MRNIPNFRSIDPGFRRAISQAVKRAAVVSVCCLALLADLRAALADAKLSDIVADFMSDADPRSIAANCAFVERHQRPQKVQPIQSSKA